MRRFALVGLGLETVVSTVTTKPATSCVPHATVICVLADESLRVTSLND